MVELRRLSWFQELRASVLDFRAATTVLRGILTTIPTGIPGARTSTIIRTPEIHIHIIPHLRDILIAGIGLTIVIIATTRARASKPEQNKHLEFAT